MGAYEIDRVRNMAGMAVEVALADELLARAEVDQPIGSVGVHLVERRAKPLIQPRHKTARGRMDRALAGLAPIALPALEENAEQKNLRRAQVLHDPAHHPAILSPPPIVHHLPSPPHPPARP